MPVVHVPRFELKQREFHEEDVVRDFHGRFADEPGGGPWLTGYDDRVAKLAAAHRSGTKGKPKRLAGGQQAATDLVTHRDGTKAVQKKAFGSSRATPKDEADREELGALVGAAVGGGDPPPVYRLSDTEVLIEYEPNAVVGASWVVDHDNGTDIYDSDGGRLLGLADLIRDNPDRGMRNWLVRPNGVIVPIDLGMAWRQRLAADQTGRGKPAILNGKFHRHFVTPQQTDWVDNDMHPEDMAIIRRRLEALRSRFQARGRLDYYDDMMARFDEVAAHATGTRRRLSG